MAAKKPPKPTSPESPSAQEQGADVRKPPGITAGELLQQLPTIRKWQQVAAYQMLAPRHGPPEGAVVHGHYRQGEHLVVLTIADVGAWIDSLLVHFETAPPPMTDEAGTTTTFLRDGAWWMTEEISREPYPAKVVPYFSYRMVMVPEAYPRTDGLATKYSLVLPNGIQVSAGGPKDTAPALVRQVFDAVDRRKLLALAPSRPAQP